MFEEGSNLNVETLKNDPTGSMAPRVVKKKYELHCDGVGVKF